MVKADVIKEDARTSIFERGPAYFYIFSYADRTAWVLYAAGVVGCLVAGVGFPA